MLGIHPNSAGETSDDTLAQLAALARGADGGPRGRFGLGETGLDYHWETCRTTSRARASFKAHLALGHALSLPVVIRDSATPTEDVSAMLPLRGTGPHAGMMHSFSGDVAMVECIALGYMISLSGASDLPQGDQPAPRSAGCAARTTVARNRRALPSPAPYRGKRDEPSRIPLMATRIASCAASRRRRCGRRPLTRCACSGWRRS